MEAATLGPAVERALADKPWRDQVTKEQIQLWQQKLASVKTASQLEEVLHYVTLEQVQNGDVPLQSEYDYLVREYKPALATRQPLKTPEDTFGEKTATRPCPKCHSRDTGFFAIQMRSADEPTSYLHYCNTCKHNWKYR